VFSSRVHHRDSAILGPGDDGNGHQKVGGVEMCNDWRQQSVRSPTRLWFLQRSGASQYRDDTRPGLVRRGSGFAYGQKQGRIRRKHGWEADDFPFNKPQYHNSDGV
jgi:hypothetical protein